MLGGCSFADDAAGIDVGNLGGGGGPCLAGGIIAGPCHAGGGGIASPFFQTFATPLGGGGGGRWLNPAAGCTCAWLELVWDVDSDLGGGSGFFGADINGVCSPELSLTTTLNSSVRACGGGGGFLPNNEKDEDGGGGGSSPINPTPSGEGGGGGGDAVVSRSTSGTSTK